MRTAAVSAICLAFTFACAAPSRGQQVSPEFLAEALKRYPAADANRDGTLTLAEGMAYLQKVRAQKAASAEKDGLAPTLANVAYGPHERNKVDFWKAKSDKPTPLVVLIHGGGFVGGDKATWRGNSIIKQLLDKGISCAAINYRFRDQAPIQDILHDAARAVQFIRSKSGEWNIDKTNIAAMGGSAGAGTSLWLTTRDDLADPTNSDPVLRESSRVRACVLNATQATYDITRWESFLGKPNAAWVSREEGAAFYGLKSVAELDQPTTKPILKECDMLSWISKDDGPVLCNTSKDDGPIVSKGQWLHSPKHAEAILKQCESVGITCTVARDGSREVSLDFLLKNLAVTGAE
jgi:acetyl esterase/lipase